MKGEKPSGNNIGRTTTKSGKLPNEIRTSSQQKEAHYDNSKETRDKQSAAKHRQNVVSQRRVSPVNRTFTSSRDAEGSKMSSISSADQIFTQRKQIPLFKRTDKSYLTHKSNKSSIYTHAIHNDKMSSKHMSQVKPTTVSSSYNRQDYLSPGDSPYSRNVAPPRTANISSRSMSAACRIEARSRSFSTTNNSNISSRRCVSAAHSTKAPSKDVNKTETQSVENGNAFAGRMLKMHSARNLNESQSKRVSVSVSSEQRTDTSPRNLSAVPKLDEESTSYSQVAKTSVSPPEIVSEEKKIDGSSRDVSGLHRIGTFLGSVAEENKTDTPCVFRPDTCESDILTVTHISMPHRKVTENEKSESPFRDVSHVDRPNHPAADNRIKDDSLVDIADSQPPTNRTDITSIASPLMMGTGVINKTNDVEKLELHFSETDFSSLLTKRAGTSNMFCVAGSTYPHKYGDTKVSPRSLEAALPKTYTTRSGSLILYSDSKIVKDKNEMSNITSSNTSAFEIHGHKMSPRTLVPHSYPSWGKLIKKSSSAQENRTTGTKRDQREYIGISSRGSNTKPYSWNYNVLPLKLINVEDGRDINTVNNLSDAVLAYRTRQPTSKDKYLAMMRQTKDGKSQAELIHESEFGKLHRSSQWTNEWIESHNSSTFNITEHGRHGFETDNEFIDRLRTSIKQSMLCRAPANTPSVDSEKHKRTYTSMGLVYRREFTTKYSNMSHVMTAPAKGVVTNTQL